MGHGHTHDGHTHDSHTHDSHTHEGHTHSHPHGDDQSGPAPAEAHNASAGQGPVLIDIGDGVGALVLLAPPSMHHVEIEVSPVGSDAARTHVAVLPRPVGRTQVYAAVYPSLARGAWQVWSPDPARQDRPVLVVDVPDGAVAEARWPDGEPV
jgi:hypothetical protein